MKVVPGLLWWLPMLLLLLGGCFGTDPQLPDPQDPGIPQDSVPQTGSLELPPIDYL